MHNTAILPVLAPQSNVIPVDRVCCKVYPGFSGTSGVRAASILDIHSWARTFHSLGADKTLLSLVLVVWLLVLMPSTESTDFFFLRETGALIPSPVASVREGKEDE